MSKRIYISGKISGLPLAEAEAKFEKAERKLVRSGFYVVNPMKVLPYDPNHRYQDYMVADIKELFDCDAVAMLAGWRDSRGARIEHHIAIEMGMRVWYEEHGDF